MSRRATYRERLGGIRARVGEIGERSAGRAAAAECEADAVGALIEAVEHTWPVDVPLDPWSDRARRFAWQCRARLHLGWRGFGALRRPSACAPPGLYAAVLEVLRRRRA